MKIVFLLSKAIVSIIILWLSIETGNANNLVISGGTRNVPYTLNTVTFNVAWDNSWNVAGLPANHDAIWVFLKYRECGQSGEWNHALLSTTMTDHTFGATVTYAKPILTTDKWGNPGAHNTGVLIRRSTLGTGTTNGTVTLKIVGASNAIILDPTKEYDIAVIGIEMVQVQSGSAFAGDGNGSTYNFSDMISSSPVNFSSEATTSVRNYAGAYSVNVAAQFPKGYDEFYCMKYEISQGQYADFLNNIGALAGSRYPNVALANMYNLINNAGVYTAAVGGVGDCTDRACNFLSANDVLTYLDWAALRPMTEFEFEKACRGASGYQANDFAWAASGAGNIVECKNVSGATSGVEICTDLNANCNYNSTNSIIGAGGSGFGAGIQGPVGVGIFARDATQTRATTGATYGGIMEMSGNVSELAIQPYTTNGYPGTPSPYTGLWGDGQISAAGIYNVLNWPLNGTYISRRGGGFLTTQNECTISFRTPGNNVDLTDYISRYSSSGGRGVR
ncbi:MAG: hypothetical protein HXX09_12185 [Bacteroidetes bacterium]|nr:hypothetical protein [Bacteroidota bacterium]